MPAATRAEAWRAPSSIVKPYLVWGLCGGTEEGKTARSLTMHKVGNVRVRLLRALDVATWCGAFIKVIARADAACLSDVVK